VARREHFDSLEEAPSAWVRQDTVPNRIARTVAADERVVALDATRWPSFSITAEQHHLDVFDGTGLLLVQTKGRKVRAQHHSDGFAPRSAPVGRLFPDPSLPFVLEV
jgi:hypothetical protein